MEIWKDIVGFEGYYKVSNYGNIYSIKKDKIRSPKHNNRGYLIITLSKDKVQSTKLVHRMVALAFLPNPENKPCIDHIDANKENNTLSNLRWCTYKENTHNSITFPKISKHINEIKMHALGKKLSVEHRAKISKPVLQFDKDRKFIKEWLSIKEASRTLGIDKKGISYCCSQKPRYKTAGGYIWSFKNKT